MPLDGSINEYSGKATSQATYKPAMRFMSAIQIRNIVPKSRALTKVKPRVAR
jgi:hypothetical protein